MRERHFGTDVLRGYLWMIGTAAIAIDAVAGPTLSKPSAVRQPVPLSQAEETALKPKVVFKECGVCPDMIAVPAGSFKMGSPGTDPGRMASEAPQHDVTIARPFAVGRFAITFAEWDACVEDGGCDGHVPSDLGWGRDRRPVVNVTWDHAKAFVAWLSRKTRKTYRLLSEAEREYVTRAGTTTLYWWGSTISQNQASYNGLEAPRHVTVPVDSFRPNPWGLYQVHGNVHEWVEDCWHGDYGVAPRDGSAWTTGECTRRVVRGGSHMSSARALRSAERGYGALDYGGGGTGFRVARTLAP